jgi:hypothetical protein
MFQYILLKLKVTVAINAVNETRILYIGHDSMRVANPLASISNKLAKPEFMGL